MLGSVIILVDFHTLYFQTRNGRYRAVTTDFFSLEMECPLESAGSCCRPKQRPSLRSILRSFIGLWVKIWHRNKTACSWLNPVQSSRSKSTTCQRKGRLLKFKLNSTATSDGSAKKLGTMSGTILNRLQPKFAAQLVANEMQPVLGQGINSDSNRTAQ